LVEFVNLVDVEKLGTKLNRVETNTSKAAPLLVVLSYFASRICESWEDAKLVSLHGKHDNIERNVALNRKVFFLTDGNSNNVKSICKTLTENGLSQVKVYVGEQLSYEEEQITSGTAKELSQKDFHSLSVMMVINENLVTEDKNTLGIKDEYFSRGQVPMTKEEVRILSIARLELEEDYKVLDIGAGTGSVSIQMAELCTKGEVIAIEKDEEALEIINQNKKKFKANNLEIISAEAMEIEPNITGEFDAIFVGGSGGNIADIIKSYGSKLKKDKNIVLNFITINNVYKAMETLKELNYEVECIQLQVSKTKGQSYMLMANNPIFVVSGKKN